MVRCRIAALRKPADLAKTRYDRNSTVIIILSGGRILLKPVAFLHSLYPEDGLGLLALPPARFQPPSSLGLPVIPSRLPYALLKAHLAPGPPVGGLFFRSASVSVVPTPAAKSG